MFKFEDNRVKKLLQFPHLTWQLNRTTTLKNSTKTLQTECQIQKIKDAWNHARLQLNPNINYLGDAQLILEARN